MEQYIERQRFAKTPNFQCILKSMKQPKALPRFVSGQNLGYYLTF